MQAGTQIVFFFFNSTIPGNNFLASKLKYIYIFFKLFFSKKIDIIPSKNRILT